MYHYVSDTFGNEPCQFSSLTEFIIEVDSLKESEFSKAVRQLKRDSDSNYCLDGEVILEYREEHYYIAFPLESGEWDIQESFYAFDDYAAEAYAMDYYKGQDWYILDKNKKNIYD